MAPKKQLIVVVEDDLRIQNLEKITLELEGYVVSTASNGEEALQLLVELRPDLVLLDLKLPGIDGLALTQRIREFSEAPIIMVTAQSAEDDKVQGLEVGADDYLTKPFSLKELVARVKAALRRASVKGESSEPQFETGDLIVDFAGHRVTVAGQESPLSATEYRILSYLARNAGRIVTPDQILERIWGEEYLGEVHLLRVAINRLRQKLGDDPKSPRYIITRPGIGYSLSLNGTTAP